MDPSLCTCRIARSNAQQFYIGDFAPPSDGEVEAAESLDLRVDSVRALRHPGSGGDGHVSDLPVDPVRALRHPGPGGDGYGSDLPVDPVRALRHPGSGGDGHVSDLPVDPVRALRHPGPGGDRYGSDLRVDSIRALRHPGSGGGKADWSATVDGPLENDGFEGYAVAGAIRFLSPVSDEAADGSNMVQWEMVIAEEKLGPCDAEGCDTWRWR